MFFGGKREKRKGEKKIKLLKVSRTLSREPLVKTVIACFLFLGGTAHATQNVLTTTFLFFLFDLLKYPNAPPNMILTKKP
jgi:hypothetical protein